MTHEEARELLLELAYGELTTDAASEVARHAAECAACGRELQRVTSTRALASALRDASAPRSGRDPLVEAARRAVAARPERRWFVRPAALSFGAAAAVILVVFGVTLQLTHPGAHRVGDGVTEAAPSPDLAAAPPARAPPSEAARPPAPAAPSPRPSPAPRPAPPPRAAAAPAPEAAAAPGPAAERGASAAPSLAPAPAATGSVAESRRQPGPARPPAPSAARERASADAEPSAGGGGAAPDLVAEVERRRAAGDLHEERRRLHCGDAVVERIALVARDGRIVQLTERAGSSTAEAWYDGAGALRASRASGEGAPALPRAAPTLDALASACAW